MAQQQILELLFVHLSSGSAAANRCHGLAMLALSGVARCAMRSRVQAHAWRCLFMAEAALSCAIERRARRAERLESRLTSVLDDFTWTDERQGVERRVRLALSQAQEGDGAMLLLMERQPWLRNDVVMLRRTARHILDLDTLEAESPSEAAGSDAEDEENDEP